MGSIEFGSEKKGKHTYEREGTNALNGKKIDVI